MSKQREFWIRDNQIAFQVPGYACFDTPNVEQVTYHVREVNPALDEAVKGLVNALEYLSTCPEPFIVQLRNGGEYVPLSLFCSEVLEAYKAATRGEE